MRREATGKLYKREHCLGEDQIFRLADVSWLPPPADPPEAQSTLHSAASGNQVDDQDDQRDHQ